MFEDFRAAQAHDAFNLQRLSAGEEFWLWRLRGKSGQPSKHGHKAFGLSQIEAAARLGISLYLYQQIEGDKQPAHRCGVHAPKSHLQPLSRMECCLLARRRSAMRLKSVAASLSLTHIRTLEIERIGDPRLIQFWKGKGFFGFPSGAG